MDYRWHYQQLIKRARNRKLEGYVEKHHAIPKCVGGDDYEHHVVELTPEEHFVAHLLLARMFPNEKGLIEAAWLMGHVRRKHKINSKAYGWLKRKKAKQVSDRWKGVKRGPTGPMPQHIRDKISASHKGRKFTEEHLESLRRGAQRRVHTPHSEETKKRIAEGNRKAREEGRRKPLTPEKNAARIAKLKQTNRIKEASQPGARRKWLISKMKDKLADLRKEYKAHGGKGKPRKKSDKERKPHSEETRKKMSEAAKNRKCSEETRKKMALAASKRIWSEESKKRISDSKKGMKHTEETKAKLREAWKTRVAKPHSEETKLLMSQRAKEVWAKRRCEKDSAAQPNERI